MSKLNNLPLANNEECKLQRKTLIENGIITPNPKNKLKIVSTIQTSRSFRKKLIRAGIIDPNPSYRGSGNNQFVPKEEGEYNPKPIITEEEYYRRRDNYFWMIYDILRVRRELNLDISAKKPDEPSWYF